MSNKNANRRTKYHDFRDTKGKTIPYAVLEAVLDQSTQWVRTQLQQEKKVPDNVHQFVKKILSPGTKRIAELRLRQEEAETQLKEGKAREIQFKNELQEGKYGLVEEFQRELDGILIRLQTNLYAIPEQVVDAIMTSRDRAEASKILLDALEHHMRDVSGWQIELTNEEEGD